ncbi:MAG: histidinol-phosphatase HisJ family protein [Candidatus Fimenecus sp.]
MYQRKLDLHVHTDNSPDGNHSPMFICERAEFDGMRAIALTDHCEVDVYKAERYDKRVRQAYFEASKAQSAFRGKVLVLRGVELGQPHYDVKTADAILSARAYDVVIGSVHNLRGREDFYFTDSFTPQEVHALLTEYFDELLNLLAWGNFDVLAHLTYPLRYFYAKSGISVNLDEYKTQIDEILKRIAETGKALEINTAGLRQPIGKLSPELETVKRFRELGGEFVTYGSDAHYAEDVGKGMQEAYDAMLAAGFTELTMFQQRTPLKLKIE